MRDLPPSSAVSIASDNANSSLAKVGDTVTISMTSSEALLATPTVTIDGNPADTVIATGLNSYEATRLMQAGDSAGVVVLHHRLHRCGGQFRHPGDIHHRQLQCELR